MEARSLSNIQDQQGLDLASDYLARGKRLYKEIKSHYDNIIKPIQKNLNAVKKERDSKLEEIEQGLNTVKNAVSGFLVLETSRRQAEVERVNREVVAAEEKARKNTIKKLVADGHLDEALELKEAPLTPMVQIVDKPVTSGGVYTSEILDYEIVDIDKVPNEYFKPRELDTKKIRSAGSDGKQIPGVRFFRKLSIGVNA